jgi:type II secretory pathway predicted ATPase ExeA
VDDARPPRSLADDPGFVAGLRELERGLGPQDEPDHAEPARRAPESPDRQADPRPAERVSDDLGFLTDEFFDGQATVPPPPAQPRRHRPLLDLFPPATVDRRRPKASLPGTALPSPPPRSAVQADSRAAPEAAPPPAYLTFYSLNENPFGLSADPRFFCPVGSHDRVLNAMRGALHASEGLVVLTGDQGLGKTTICRAAGRALDRRTVQSLVLDPPQSIEQLLQTVLVDFGVVSHGDLARTRDLPRDALTTALASFLKSLAALKATAVIIVDEAQAIPEVVLAGIPDVVAALDAPRLLQIVLAGEPALTPRLARAGPRAPDGGTGVSLELRPLQDDEIAPYIRHRLEVAGGGSRVEFSPAACARIHALSGGVPRQVNLLCGRALIQGADGAASVIDAGLVDRAAQDLALQIPAEPRPPRVRAAVLVAAFLALMLAGGAGAVWVFRDAANDAFYRWLDVPPAPPAPAPLLPERPRPRPIPDNALPPADNLPNRRAP